MNIATSTATPPATPLPAPTAADTTPDAPRTVPGDVGSVADATDAAGIAKPGFGHMLSQSIARDDAATAAPRSKGDATLPAAATAVDGVEPAAAADATKETRTDTSTADPAVGDDLAAQLALVSQWAALAAQGGGATGVHATGVTDSVDVRAKLETVRGTATAAPTRRTTPSAVDADPALAAAAADDPTARAPAVASLAATALGRLFQPATGVTARTTAAAPADPHAKAVSATDPLDDRIVPSGGTDTAPAKTATLVEQIFATVVATHASTGVATTGGNPVAALSTLGSGAAAQVPNAPQELASTALTADLHETVGTPAWSHEVGQATLRMAANDLQNVSLRLNPEHLGPVDVQMRIADGVAHLQFAAAHADTRSALEGSKTTLDQLFSSQGIKLGDWSVGQQSSNATLARDFGAAMRGDGGRRGTSQESDGSDATPLVATVTARTTHAIGLVDTFA